MAKSTKFMKVSRNKRTGTVTKRNVTTKNISRRDIKSQQINAKKEIELAKLNNSEYQKHVTKRLAGAEAAGAIVTPTTVALSNTDAFSSGGFDMNNNQSKEDTDKSDSVNNNIGNGVIWG